MRALVFNYKLYRLALSRIFPLAQYREAFDVLANKGESCAIKVVFDFSS